MPTFKDRAGREWALDLDAHLVGKIEERTPVKVGRLAADLVGGADSLFDDPVLFVRVLWVMVEEQAAKLGVAAEAFGRGFAGDAIEDATAAFLEALAEFSPRHQRATLRAMVAKGKEVGAAAAAKALAAIEAFDPFAPPAAAGG